MTINWFGDHFVIPIWLGISVIAVFVAILFLILYFALKSDGQIYFCPKCEKRFKAKMIFIMTSRHINDERMLRCPHCHKKSLCYPSHDQNEDQLK